MKIKKLLDFVDSWSDYIIWLIAVAGMFGSLYFSEVQDLPPCTLCWYQRILLYPFVAIYAVGILIKDKKGCFLRVTISSPGLDSIFLSNTASMGCN